MASRENTITEAWTCGHPSYKYPLPTPEVTPWADLLERQVKKDSVRCMVWKEEVQNILIFAGLFSAVVTAFLIESHKLLGRVNFGSKTMEDSPDRGFLTLEEDTCVFINTVWFLSLVFNLATVLVGIVSLQWIRQYQQPTDELEPQIAFSRYQMQAEALDRWFVPQVFTALPLLLQVALVLFLVGLNALLWALNRTVARWVAPAIALTLFFLFATTVLPTLQAIRLFVPWRMTGNPHSPCPFKSPQSRAVHRLISLIVYAFMRIFGKEMKTHKEVNVEDIVSTAARENWGRNLPGGTEILFRRHSRNTWLDYDVAWLFRRDFEQMTLANGGEGPTEVFWNRPVPLYDAVRGLLEAKRRASSPHTSTEADHCIAATLEETTREGKPLYARFLHRLARSQPLTFGLPPELTTDDPNVLQEVATLQLFSCDGGCNIPSEAKMMALEICIRLTHWMYAGTESRMQNPGASPDGPPQRLPIQWVVEMMEQPDNGITKEKMKDIRYQVRLIVQQFFKRAKASHRLLAANGSMDTNVYLSRFLSSAAKILTMTRDLDGGTGDHWHDICTEIIECIQSGDSDLTSDYAFQAALMFCEAILTHSGSKVVVAESQSLRDFVQIICKHEASVGQRPREAVVHYDRVRRLFMEKVQDPMLGIDTGVDPSILAKLAGGWSDSSLGHFSIQIDTDASSTISDFSQAAEISDNTRAVTS